ncbi:MAG: MerR family transcriptional regulator [Eubacteriaceae bacterium]|nr:MerR family transcriptional regulator [Eubacteriaceae bacterium]
MQKQKVEPQEYMSVGEVAKKMNTTVRTLQYYDKQGVLSPSCVSDGGRRLYSDKDIVKLHQVQSMKYLGFSLSDIKNKLALLDTPAAVSAMLAEQAATVRDKIENLASSLRAIETLREEVMKMQSVDFKKYADIIINLQMKNEFYWAIKHFDDKTLDHIRSQFDKESGTAYLNALTRVQEEAIRYQNDSISPGSEQGQALAEEFWNMVVQFTGGDMSMLASLVKLAEDLDGSEDDWNRKMATANLFIEPALEIYLANLGVNPFEEAQA